MNMKFLICGLGNIGDEYANTRHNIGFIALDAIAKELKTSFIPGRLASVAEANFKGKKLILIKPSTYMNLSGKAVKYWLTHEKLLPEQMLVIHDDLDIPLGAVRLRKKGSGGTHNGMNDIIDQLQTEEFPRLRFGIGKDFARGMQVDFVLGRWTKAEEELILPRIPIVVEAVKSFVTRGTDRTMNDFNKR
jgi:PTH1 family peptidyl-tRNA hydrolase